MLIFSLRNYEKYNHLIIFYLYIHQNYIHLILYSNKWNYKSIKDIHSGHTHE